MEGGLGRGTEGEKSVVDGRDRSFGAWLKRVGKGLDSGEGERKKVYRKAVKSGFEQQGRSRGLLMLTILVSLFRQV